MNKSANTLADLTAKNSLYGRPFKQPSGLDTGLKLRDRESGESKLALCLLGESGPALLGFTTKERLRRQFARKGVDVLLSVADAARHAGPVIVVRADAVLDPPLVSVLIETSELLLMSDHPANMPLAAHVAASNVAFVADVLEATESTALLHGLKVRTPAELGVRFWKALRKRETPYAFAVTPITAAGAEWRIFMGTYKGATDIVTKHLWPVPAFHITRYLARHRITPNTVTLLAALLTALAFWLFLRGDFALGLAAAWLMTFLDTVDGKLARVTLTSSKWGDILDHGIDLIHPPFWYVAWALGLGAVGLAWSAPTYWWMIAAILGGYMVQRIMEGIAIKWLGLEIHIWRKLDTLFRQVTARRNPNLILLTLGVIIARPDWGLMAVAVWTVVCLALHALQLLQALAARRSGPLTSWMMQG